jgi:hypothetical protein
VGLLEQYFSVQRKNLEKKEQNFSDHKTNHIFELDYLEQFEFREKKIEKKEQNFSNRGTDHKSKLE